VSRRAKRLSVYACIAALPLGAASFMLSNGPTHQARVSNANESHVTDVPFRDGLYLGKLDAENGREQHPSIGRWNTSENRASFKLGYEEGYRQVRNAKAARGPH
jgi:hypothetical protein